MAKRTGSWVWFECITPDVEKAKGLYGELFGWKIVAEPMEGGMSYEMITVPGREDGIGGVMAPPAPGIPPHWLSYVSVEDVDATAQAIVAEGGEKHGEAMDIPGVGRICIVSDPAGAGFSLFAAAGDDPPMNTEVGTFFWTEHLSPDPEAALAFYEKVFGYTHDAMEMGEGRYFVLKHGDNPIAGLTKAPEDGAPPGWLVYVKVKDCEDTAARAEKLGATLSQRPTDVGVGVAAILREPTGTSLAVIQPHPRD